MSAIRSTNTAPEALLCSLLRSQGLRFHTNVTSLPGKPDLVFKSRKKVIFVHGCFWHRHHCPAGRSIPSTRRRFWISKLGENKKRDARQLSQLRRLGWGVKVIWQCQLKHENTGRLLSRVLAFLQLRGRVAEV